MIDPSTWSSLAQLASFAADFLIARKSKNDDLTAEEFRKWLQEEAFPRLLSQSDQAMTTLLSLKANQREQFDQILALLEQIRGLVSSASPAGKWSALQAPEQQILKYMYERAIAEPDATIGLSEEDLQSASGVTASTMLRQHIQHLYEEKLVRVWEGTGARFIADAPEGLLLAWAVVAPLEYRAGIDQLRNLLPRQPELKYFGDLVSEANVPERLAYALLETWKAEGMLRFDDDAGVTSHARIHHVAEKMFRS